MKKAEPSLSDEKVKSARKSILEHKVQKANRWKRRALVHVFVFILSFIIAMGVAVLDILLFVRPDAPLTQLITVLMYAIAFVGSFAGLRMFVLHLLLHEYPNAEDDPGITHHLSKSIAYGFVALVIALVFVSLIVNFAEATVF